MVAPTTDTLETQALIMVGFLASELEEAIEGMEDMIPYVPDYFRNKWNHDAFITRARAALVSYQAFKASQDSLPSEASQSVSKAIEQLSAVKTAMKQNGLI